MSLMTIAELADLIRANPNCIVTVDNDYWWIDRTSYDNNPFDDDDERASEWEEANRLVCSDAITEYGGGYGSGSSYGGDVLQALAMIVGIRVESV